MAINVSILFVQFLMPSMVGDFFKGIATDQHNNPVADCVIANNWSFKTGHSPQARRSKIIAKSNSLGEFQLDLRETKVPCCFLVMDSAEKIGSLLLIKSPSDLGPRKLVLSDLVKARGSISSLLPANLAYRGFLATIGVRNYGTLGNVYADTKCGSFEISIPVGNYILGGSSQFHEPFLVDVEIASGSKAHDIGKLRISLNTFGKLIGKTAPEWSPTAAANPSHIPTVMNSHGKWLLVEFWPATSFLGKNQELLRSDYEQRLRSLVSFQTEFLASTNKFEIVLYYIAPLDDFDDRSYISGRSISDTWGTVAMDGITRLLDRTQSTVSKWGVGNNHQSVLISPDGKVMPCMTAETLLELRRRLSD